MTELKCPFCGEKLQQTYSFNPRQFWCSNYYNHKHPINLQGTKELWQALIDTKKKLDICVSALTVIAEGLVVEHQVVGHEDDNKMFIAKHTLEQINQKEQQ